MLPSIIQQMFNNKDTEYNLRAKFLRSTVRTTKKQMFITRRGVDLWNNIDMEFKTCTSIEQFKQRYKQNIFNQYAQSEM